MENNRKLLFFDLGAINGPSSLQPIRSNSFVTVYSLPRKVWMPCLLNIPSCGPITTRSVASV